MLIAPDNAPIQLRGIGAFKLYDAIVHCRTPELGDKVMFRIFIRIDKTMEHEPELPITIIIVKSFTRTEFAWFHISLALSGAEENVSSASKID